MFIIIRNYSCSIISPTSSRMGWPLRFLFIEQTAALVVASISSCNVIWFAVVANHRSMSISNIVAMRPTVVVVEPVVLFWRIA